MIPLSIEYLGLSKWGNKDTKKTAIPNTDMKVKYPIINAFIIYNLHELQ